MYPTQPYAEGVQLYHTNFWVWKCKLGLMAAILKIHRKSAEIWSQNQLGIVLYWIQLKNLYLEPDLGTWNQILSDKMYKEW